MAVFIHRSNKTRIETAVRWDETDGVQLFLYIDPIKQGLKRENYIRWSIPCYRFYT